jgi:hypothetical protein
LGVRLGNLAAVLLAAGLVLLIAVRWRNYQWDFAMFRWSASDYLVGKDPYRGEGLSFFHPPIFLPFYSLFARIPYRVGYELWLAAKMVCLTALLLVWNRYFVRLRPAWPTILFFVFAFNGAIYADLVSGNVSLFEQSLIWLGFALMLKERYAASALCIALSAQWKVTPLFLLSALMFAPKPQWAAMVAGLAAFGGLFSLNLLVHPDLFTRFRQVVPLLDERAPDNPCTLALLRDIADMLGRAGVHVPSAAVMAVYCAISLGIVTVSAAYLLRRRREGRCPDLAMVCLFLCVVLALISPRFKTYSYILVLVPTLYALRARPRQLVPLIAVFAFITGSDSTLPFRSVLGLLAGYTSLFAVLALWGWYVREIARWGAIEGSEEDGDSRPAPPLGAVVADSADATVALGRAT